MANCLPAFPLGALPFGARSTAKVFATQFVAPTQVSRTKIFPDSAGAIRFFASEWKATYRPVELIAGASLGPSAGPPATLTEITCGNFTAAPWALIVKGNGVDTATPPFAAVLSTVSTTMPG